MSQTESTGAQSFEERLTGWKRISNYLGCSERTARRWEREEQLPVHRQAHEKRSTVFALPAELDSWLSSRAEFSPVSPAGQKSGGRRGNRFALGVTAIVVIAVVALAVVWPRTGVQNPEIQRDPVAVDLFERGTALWRQRGEEPSRQAVKLLSQAVERDDDYAEAWAALATAWMTLPTYSDEVSVSEATDEALLAADRALELDASLVEARIVIASIAKGRGDWITSERIHRNALEVDPDSTSLMLWFAGHYRELGLIDEAVKLTDAAMELEPNSPPILTEVAMNHFHLGQVEKAQDMLDYLWFDLGVETPVVWLGRWFAMIEDRDFEAAGVWLDETPFRPFTATLQRHIDAREGKSTELSSLVAETLEAYENGLPAWLAFHLLDQIGESDAALAVLDQESSKGYFGTSIVLFYERSGGARKRAEFSDYIERLGFFDYWRVRGAPDICKRDGESAVCQRLSEESIRQ